MSPQQLPRDSLLTAAAIAALAYMAAAVAHEAIGHGGACWAAGGTIVRLGSAFFRCSPGMRIVDAAGPLANLLTAALAFLALRRCRECEPLLRMFLLLVVAFNVFWSAGQMVYSAALVRDDWAFALRGLLPEALWRPGLILFGAILYSAALVRVKRDMPSLTTAPRALLLIAYVTAGLVACAAAAFYAPDRLGAVRECALETFAANAGLLLLWRQPQAVAARTAPSAAIAWDAHWVVAAAVAFTLFAAFLGRGL